MNLYTYSNNNPIAYIDPTGHFFQIAVGALIGGLVNTAITAVSDYMDDKKFNKGFKEYAGAFVEGAVIGGVAAATGGASLATLVASEAVAGAVGNAAKQYISKGKVNGKEALTTGALSAVTAGATKIIGAALKPIIKTKVVQQFAGKAKEVVQGALGKVKTAIGDTLAKPMEMLGNIRGGIQLGSSAGASEVKYVDLYHGTSKEAAAAIRKGGIDLGESRPDLDFGKGFYTTRDEAQAMKWASRKSGGGEVLNFRVPEPELNNLNGLKFNEPSSSWGEFVRHNRNVEDMHGYDYVEGPMLGNPGPFMNGSAPKAFGNQISFHGQNPVDMLMRYLQR